MKALATSLALITAILTLATPANAATDGFTVDADLDGDGRTDRATIEPVVGDPGRQLLTVTIRGDRVATRVTALIPLASPFGVRPPRVVDLDADGRDEIVVVESVGANTDGSTAWGLFGGLRPVTSTDGTPLRLWEGGGISALSRYGCEPADGARRLVTVAATLVDRDNLVYAGDRVTYTVTGGVAVETTRQPVTGARDDAAFQTDPGACA